MKSTSWVKVINMSIFQQAGPFLGTTKDGENSLVQERGKLGFYNRAGCRLYWTSQGVIF